MLRGEDYYYNDSEVLHYELCLRSYSSSSSSMAAQFRITENAIDRETEYTNDFRILEGSSSSSSSSTSTSSSSVSVPFRYQDEDSDCALLGGSGSGGSSDAPGPLISLNNRGIKPLKHPTSGRVISGKTKGT